MIPFKPTFQKPSPTDFVDKLLEDQSGGAPAEVGTVLLPKTVINDHAANGVQAFSHGVVQIALMLQDLLPAEPGLSVADQPLRWRAPTGFQGSHRQPEPSAQPKLTPVAVREGRLSGPVLPASPAAAAAEQHKAAQLSLVKPREAAEVEEPAAANIQGHREAQTEGNAQLAQQASHTAVPPGEYWQCQPHPGNLFVEVQGTCKPFPQGLTCADSPGDAGFGSTSRALLHRCRLV